MVDKRITVALKSIYGIIAVNLLLGYWVIAVPFQKQVNTPLAQGWVSVFGNDSPLKLDILSS